MGICWSEPSPHVTQRPSHPVYAEKVVPSAPPYQPPMTQYPPQYTYAMKPEQYYQYQYAQQYQQYALPQQYAVQPVYPQQRQISPATAFVGGLVLGAIAEDILDPTE